MLFASWWLAGFSFAQEPVQQQDKLQKRDRIHQEEHLMFKDGKMYQYRNGEPVELKSQIRLKNGTVCNPDGSCFLQNKEQIRLRNGACVDMEGNFYRNQNMFNLRKMEAPGNLQRIQQRNMQRTPGTPGTPGSGGNNMRQRRGGTG